MTGLLLYSVMVEKEGVKINRNEVKAQFSHALNEFRFGYWSGFGYFINGFTCFAVSEALQRLLNRFVIRVAGGAVGHIVICVGKGLGRDVKARIPF